MIDKNILKLIGALALIIFNCTGVYSQILSNQNDNGLIARTHLLTPEEERWITEHPILKATSKIDTAPNEFIRAGVPVGFSIDYLNLIAQIVGFKIEYVTGISWTQSVESLKNRQIDISHNIFQTPERDQYLNFSDPYINMQFSLFAREGTDAIYNLEGLKDKIIGVVSGWGPLNELRQNNPNLNIVEFPSSLEGLLSVSEEKTDLYISPFITGTSLVSKNFIPNIIEVGNIDFLKISNNDKTRIAARNDWPELIKILQKGMAAVTPSQYDELFEKWHLQSGVNDVLDLSQEERVWLTQNRVIKVAADPSLRPVEFIDNNGNMSGISGAYMDIISRKLNVSFEWSKNESFNDGLSKITNKEADILSAASPNADREKNIFFTDSYMTVNSIIFAREGEQVFGNMEGLFGYSIAQVEGFINTEWIIRDYPEIKVVTVPTIAEALNLVSAGVVDAHIGSVPITSHNIAMESFTNLVVAGVTPYKGEIAMGIRKDLPLLASAINKALESVTDEERAIITKDWINLKTAHKQDYTLVWQILAAAIAVVILILIWNYSLRREVSQRKLSEERFRQIAETIDGVFFICAPDFKQVKYVSPNFEKWTNMSCQELYDDPNSWTYLIHPDDKELYKHSVTRTVNSNFMMNITEFRIVNHTNEIKWLSIQAQPVRDRSGKVINIAGLITDITESVKSRAELNEISNQFQNAFTYASHGMVLIALDGSFLRTNDAFGDIINYSNQEILSKNVSSLTHPDDLKMSILMMNEVLKGKRPSFELEVRYFRKDGALVPTQLNVSLVRDDNGLPVHFVAQIQDLSALKEREEQLRHSQKMDAVGKLTGGIAHDFNNILGIILGNLEILKNTVQDEPKANLRVEKAINGVERGSNLIKKLLSFSRKTPQTSELILINDCIINLKDFMAKSLTVSINIDTHFAQDLWLVEVDAGDLEDAILNLVLNARDAMFDEGELSIVTENVVLDEEFINKNRGAKRGEYVMVSVTDTGTGISEEIIDKVLEPFFTTKTANKGTGLGLSMVHGFIQRSGGYMKINSKPGEGTTFKIYIPRSYINYEIAVNELKDPKILPSGNETILVVDDEQHLCDVAETQLNHLGYSVFTANSASYALEILNKNKNIDLLFSDIVMPDNLDGYKMASSALKIQPELKILLTSGFSQNLEKNIDEDDKEVSALAQNILHKPYNQFELAVAVRKSLDV